MEHEKLNKADDSEIAESENRRKSPVGILRIVVAMAVAAIAVMPKNAGADESYGTEFGDDVNWIQKEGCPTNWMPGVGGAQLMPGYKPNRFKFTFMGGSYPEDNCENHSTIVAKEFEVDDAPDGGIIIKGLGKALPLDPSLTALYPALNIDGQSLAPNSLIEVDRGDGRTSKIKQYGNDKIFKDDELKWEKTIIDGGEDFGKWYSDFSAIHQCATAKNHIKLTDAGLFFDPASDDLIGGTFRIDSNTSNYYDSIQQSINDAWENEGKDPYEAGLLKHIEDGAFSAPETDTLLIVGKLDSYYEKGGDWFVAFDSNTNQYFHLKRNLDGTWVKETPQVGEVDLVTGGFSPAAVQRVVTPSNKKIHLVFGGSPKINWAGGYTIAKVLALEELPGGTFKEISITIEEKNQYPDDDGDGKVNHEDNCRWRANPDQVNSTADENGDACKADCKDGGWPGVDSVPLQTNSSGLRVCQSELGFNFAFSFEDGSTIYSNMDNEVLNGKIMLKPGQVVRYIHSWDPRTEKLPAHAISLPAGNSVKIKVNSAKNLDGTDGQIVFNHDGNVEYFNGAGDWQDFGIVSGGEIENASDIEIEVGNENPLPVVETQAEQAQQAEPVQVVETPQTAEIPTQVETPLNSVEEVDVAVAEQPNIAEQPGVAEISVAAEPTPDVLIGEPNATAEVAEETGVVVLPVEPQQPEPQVEPTQAELIVEQTAEPAPDVIQNSDTPQGTDISADTKSTLDTSFLKDTADAGSEQDLKAGVDTAKTDQITGTDTPVQSKDMPQGKTDTNQLVGKDTENPQPKPEEKSKSGGGCNCAIENPDNNFSAEIFTTFGAAIAAWLISRRRQLKKILAHD